MRRLALILGGMALSLPAYATQTYLGADASYHTGPTDNSHVKQFSYGGVFQSETEGPLRYVLGLSAKRGTFDLTLSGSSYEIISLDLQLRLGVQLDLQVFSRNRLRPILAAYGLGGANLITSSAPPADVSTSASAYGWGYEFEAGLHFRTVHKNGIRFSGAYRKYQYSYGGQSVAADAFCGRVGLVF